MYVSGRGLPNLDVCVNALPTDLDIVPSLFYKSNELPEPYQCHDDYIHELPMKYPHKIIFSPVSNKWTKLKNKNQDELEKLRAIYNYDSIDPIIQTLDKDEINETMHFKCADKNEENQNLSRLKIRTRPSKNSFKKNRDNIEIDYTVITVAPRTVQSYI